jgi:hypothetical protein
MGGDHVRLIDGEGNLVKNKNGGTAFSYAEGVAVSRRQTSRPG